VDLRTGLDVLEKIKITCLCRGWNPEPSIQSPNRYTEEGSPAPTSITNLPENQIKILVIACRADILYQISSKSVEYFGTQYSGELKTRRPASLPHYDSI
jgi:hypothetical protein